MTRLKPGDVFPRGLSDALRECGEYVYAYYEPGAFQPFYVGKGTGTRVLSHWKDALGKAKGGRHIEKLREILGKGQYPNIRLLAYSLERSSAGKRYSVAERVLQDAFGIQSVWEKTDGIERLEDSTDAILLQKRQDSAGRPPLSLEAVVARASRRPPTSRDKLGHRATKIQMPILLVGLSKTYDPSYQPQQLCEMARMYWSLDRYENSSLPTLRKANRACLLAWSSVLTGKPVVVGVWQIRGNKHTQEPSTHRYEFHQAWECFKLKRELLGLRLEGTGNHWQGPRIFLPAE